MNDRTNNSANTFGAIAAADAAAAASNTAIPYVDSNDMPLEVLSLNDLYAGWRWTDRHWHDKRSINPEVARHLAEVDAALMGIHAVSRLLFCDEVHADDAELNPEQFRYEALSPTTREGLRVAQAFMLDKAMFAIECVRTNST